MTKRPTRSGGALVSLTTPLLTDQGLGALELVRQGMTNRQIKDALYVSEDTVKRWLSEVYEKLQVPDRASAVDVVWRLGIYHTLQRGQHTRTCGTRFTCPCKAAGLNDPYPRHNLACLLARVCPCRQELDQPQQQAVQ